MVFSSIVFLFRFLPIVILLYTCVPKAWKNGVLFLASLFFYAWGEPVYVVLMLFSTVVDYCLGAVVEKSKEAGKLGRARAAVAASAVVNLSLLSFFKYSDFLIGTVNQAFSLEIPMPGLALPIGISFYTFQTMSYTIDIYRGDANRQKNIIAFGAYVALFPQLIAGPIVRYQTIAKELTDRKYSLEQMSRGALTFAAGLGKKVLLANTIGLLWSRISESSLETMPVLTAWMGILAFAFQIYFDFSGYSDMAIGLGTMFGFHFPENFRYPYESKSITEFWRRWHISLGTWFKEYVYIPLGGNRGGLRKQIRNIAIVWLLTGIWHGAGWNFVLWGVYFGLLLIVEKLFLLKRLEQLPGILSHAYAVLCILVGWVIFALEDMGRAAAYLRAMFFPVGGWFNQESFYFLCNYGILFLVLIFGCTHLPKALWQRIRREEVFSCVGMAVVFLLSIAFLVNASYNPFLYFRF